MHGIRINGGKWHWFCAKEKCIEEVTKNIKEAEKLYTNEKSVEKT